MTHYTENEGKVRLETLPIEEIARQASDLLDQGYH
jgi:hypothetical protein